MSNKNHTPELSKELLYKLSSIIGDHLTHSKIDSFFLQENYKYICPQGNKTDRVYNTFASQINRSKNFIKTFNTLFNLINPNRFDNQKEYDDFLYQINSALAIEGCQIFFEHNKKQLKTFLAEKNINSAKIRSNSLKAMIEIRNLHPIMLEFCQEEYLQENYFHSVLEAAKSIYSVIRSKTNLTGDGNELIDKAFSTKNPYLKINNLSSKSEISEQIGFSNLLKGITSMFRNTTAHEAKIEWEITKNEAIDIFTIISYAHHKIDSAEVVTNHNS